MQTHEVSTDEGQAVTTRVIGNARSNQSAHSLNVRKLSCLRDDRVLFDNLNIHLDAGQVLLVEGRNGSGKTSLLRILCGIRLPESGEVFWCGKPIHELGAAFHEQMAYVGHHDGIKGDLTVLENIRLARALGKPSSAAIDDILEQIKLSGYEDVMTQALSAGQRRKLALSRLLATDSLLWILDEPFTSLDRSAIEMFEGFMLAHTAAGGMVILTSHHEVNLKGLTPISLCLSP